jgi:sugar phosphate isomerase/epimerase
LANSLLSLRAKGLTMPTAPELSVSNIAFPGAELGAAIALLRRLNISAIEVAPYNVFGRWDIAVADLDAFRKTLADSGLRCPAMQGIVYNAPGAHLFASSEARDALYRHLVMIAKMAGVLGARACVFGAPKLRDPGDLPPLDARAIAVDFFRRIAPVFTSEGAMLTFEPNARQYACRFITTTAEAIDLVEEIGTEGVGLQIDTGTLFLEHEDPRILIRAARHAGHAHVSEPDLAPLGTSGTDHRPVATALRASGYRGPLSIEMRAVAGWQAAIENAVALVREIYLT